MKDARLTFSTDLPGDEPLEWVGAIEQIAEDFGYFEPLGPQHYAAFLDAGRKLLVTFENAETVRATLPDAEPRGFAFARREGWSHLGLFSEGESWFRDGHVYRFFDRLVDDGFFEDFDQVLFHGAHAAGYAAAAFSVAAPGARVLAIRPQATLDARVAGWDTRYLAQRRLSFTDRYGYAPEMIDAAERAYVVFNPAQRFDAMHAALFTRRHVTMLRADGLGWRLDAAFDSLDIHDSLIRDAMWGELTPARFGRLIRGRKGMASYQRNLLKRARDKGHPVLAATLCASILSRKPDSFFEAELETLMQAGYAPLGASQASAAE